MKNLISKVLRLKDNKTSNTMNDFNSHEVVLLSFPKSGRTWVRAMLGTYYLTAYNINANSTDDHIEVSNLHQLDPKIPNYGFYHDTDKGIFDKHYQDVTEVYINQLIPKIVFMVRDPRDVLVSSYFQKIKRDVYDENLSSDIRDNIDKNMSIEEYVTQDIGSLKTLVLFMNKWARVAKKKKDFHTLTYEDLHQNVTKEVEKLLRFVGEKEIDTDALTKAINYGNFENMHKLEREKPSKSNRLRATNLKDHESFKTRKGQVGGYNKYFNKKILHYIDEYLQKNLDNFYHRYKYISSRI